MAAKHHDFSVPTGLNSTWVTVTLLIVFIVIFGMMVWNCVYYSRIVSDRNRVTGVSIGQARALLVINALITVAIGMLVIFYIVKIFLDRSSLRSSLRKLRYEVIQRIATALRNRAAPSSATNAATSAASSAFGGGGHSDGPGNFEFADANIGSNFGLGNNPQTLVSVPTKGPNTYRDLNGSSLFNCTPFERDNMRRVRGGLRRGSFVGTRSVLPGMNDGFGFADIEMGEMGDMPSANMD